MITIWNPRVFLRNHNNNLIHTKPINKNSDHLIEKRYTVLKIVPRL